MLNGYLAPEGFDHILEKELHNVVEKIGRLFIAEGDLQHPLFVQNIWLDVKKIDFVSIGDAAKQLRALGALWAPYQHAFVRRSTLIEEKLPFFRPRPLDFPCHKIPPATLGAYTMISEKSLYAAAKTTSPFAHGMVCFKESMIPPSRAYLKLWEAFTLLGTYPLAGQKCLEIGAAPGSWTWVLQQLGAEVIAVDRAHLSPHIAELHGVHFMKKDAFSIKPSDFPSVQWVFSDVICYPQKLFEWVSSWLEQRPDVNFICTLKFQEGACYDIAREFEKIPGSRLFHLYHNKHELTWALIRK